MQDNFYSGFNGGQSGNGPDLMEFFFRRSMAKVATATIVKVIAVYNTGGVAPVGVVDVQPLVNQTDGQGNVTALPPVYGVPYSRLQGGTNAVIIDPQVGDIGIAVFGDRDLSAVVASKAQSAPGSNRRNSLSDALYIGGILNGTPVQYVQFTSSGITVNSPTKVTIVAPNTEVDGNLKVTGTTEMVGAVTADATITATGEIQSGSIKLTQHVHTGVQTGGSNTGLPTG